MLFYLQGESLDIKLPRGDEREWNIHLYLIGFKGYKEFFQSLEESGTLQELVFIRKNVATHIYKGFFQQSGSTEGMQDLASVLKRNKSIKKL